jgi:formate-dependent phosphoribosylglycinamide formyltransferase (GAR transformylase)
VFPADFPTNPSILPVFRQELAQKVATDAIKSFGDARGIFGVEMFLLEDRSAAASRRVEERMEEWLMTRSL